MHTYSTFKPLKTCVTKMKNAKLILHWDTKLAEKGGVAFSPLNVFNSIRKKVSKEDFDMLRSHRQSCIKKFADVSYRDREIMALHSQGVLKAYFHIRNCEQCKRFEDSNPLKCHAFLSIIQLNKSTIRRHRLKSWTQSHLKLYEYKYQFNCCQKRQEVIEEASSKECELVAQRTRHFIEHDLPGLTQFDSSQLQESENLSKFQVKQQNRETVRSVAETATTSTAKTAAAPTSTVTSGALGVQTQAKECLLDGMLPANFDYASNFDLNLFNEILDENQESDSVGRSDAGLRRQEETNESRSGKKHENIIYNKIMIISFSGTETIRREESSNDQNRAKDGAKHKT